MNNIFKKIAFFFIPGMLLWLGCQKNHYNLADLPPVVKGFFTVAKTNFDIDEGIRFTNASQNAESYTWDFGDGTKSTEKDPDKTYSVSGTFTVILKAVGPGGTGSFSKDIVIIDPHQNASDKELYFIEYGNELIRKIVLQAGATAETVADISGRAGVGLAYDSVGEKIYFTDFEIENEGKIWRMNVDGTNLETIVSGITDPYSIAVNAKAGKIYWADDAGNISRANLDGTDLERQFIHIDGGWMRGVVYNNKTEVIYFGEINNEDIYSAKSDGTGVGKIISGTYGYSIFMDEVNEKLYYEDQNEEAIMQCNLDGSGIVKITDAPDTRIFGMALDYNENKFYWADRDNNVIKRSNLDGSGVEPFLSGVRNPRGLLIK